jgi:hypothetical protein
MHKGYVWRPGDGIEPEALHRLRDYFRRPKSAMGEAWFMGGDRRHFPELMGDLDALGVDALLRPLGEMASGTASFGQRREWHDWFHYLLAQRVTDDREWAGETLTELLVTGFMAHYADGVASPPYPGFAQDVLETLGRSLMEPRCWQEGDIVVGRLLHRSNHNPNQVWCWWDASGDLSAALLLCAKYLPASEVRGWFRSVLAIESPHWRAQMIVWLIGAHDLLTGLKHAPSELDSAAYPAITWGWSHCLHASTTTEAGEIIPIADWLPQAARTQLLDEVHACFTDEVFVAWLESIGRIDYLQRELADLPSTFERLYLRRS